MKEIRNNDIINRSDNSESRIIEGYAIVFNSRSEDLGGFYETINPNAVTQETIDNSDILFLLDHNTQRGVLARSNKGKGSLKLELDEKGLKFSFECPDTSTGNEVMIGIKRGDISKCSFAFSVESDEYTKESDGTILRTINKINRLYDCSVVYHPAYNETSVDTRGLEAFLSHSDSENNQDNINTLMKNNKRSKEDILKEIENLQDELRSQEEEVEETEKETDEMEEKEDSEDTEKEEKNCEDSETDKEEKSEEEETEDKEEKDNSEDESDEEERKNKASNLYNKETRNNNFNIKNNHSTMSKKFSLISTINDVVNNRNFNEVSADVITRSKDFATKSGINFGSDQIVISNEVFKGEKRAVANPNGILAQEATYGQEAVPQELFNIVGALRDKMVLADAGARFINVTGNIDIPVYSGSSCGWEDEIGEAVDGSGKFSSIHLEPRRITAVLPISRLFLAQTSDSAEEMLRDDLVNAVAEKLQQTILGDGVGDAKTPQGLMYNVTADANDFEYEDAVNIEEYLETKNFNTDNARWIVAPSSKATMRATKVDAGSGRFVMENGEVLGTKAYSTNSMVSNGVIYGDFSELIIANWDSLSILVDPYTLAAKNQIRLVVHFFVNYALRRPDALVKRVIK